MRLFILLVQRLVFKETTMQSQITKFAPVRNWQWVLPLPVFIVERHQRAYTDKFKPAAWRREQVWL